LAVHLQPNLADITSALVDYILSQHPSKFTRETLPRDESLLELEVLLRLSLLELNFGRLAVVRRAEPSSRNRWQSRL
jgi:hypothetical protein